MPEQEETQRRGAYASDTSDIASERSLVALVDFLGFSAQIHAAEAEGRLKELLNRIHQFVGGWRAALADRYSLTSDRRRRWEVKFFTDNIVFGYPLGFEGGDPEVAGLLNFLGLIQVDAIREGFFVRGGLSCGELYMDEDIVFGVPLVEAHEAEACTARWPRIVLAKSARHFLAERMGPRLDIENAPFYRDFVRDEDGEWFINYLEASFHDYTEPPEFSWIDTHRNMITARLADYGDSPRIRQKYEWAARYHNFWCDSWRIPLYRIAGYESLRVGRVNYAELVA